MTAGVRFDGGGTDPDPGEALYVFRVEFRLEPTDPAVRATPDVFETSVFRSADEPGEAGWLFFRDNCWHGELSAPEAFAADAAATLGVPVVQVRFRELRTSPGYLAELRTAIGDHLEEFGQESVDGALAAHLGSSIHVVE